VLEKKEGLQAYYEERYPAWERSYDKNGADFQVLHRPLDEWRVLLKEQERERERKEVGREAALL
jgi:hypothetical protein